MPENKKHHYVPLFYLKRFSLDGKAIDLFNWKSGAYVKKARLKTQCYRDYFYGTDLKVEHALGITEGAFARFLAVIDDCLLPPIYQSEGHALLLLHVLMQYGRTLYAAEALNEMVDDLAKHLLGPKARADGIDLSRLKIEMFKPASFVLSNVVQSLPLCQDLEYKLIINNTKEKFVVSDNPVALYNQLFSFRSTGGNTGLASKGLQIYFPLDSKKAMFFYDRDVYQVGRKSSCVVTLNNPQDVYELNTLQMCSALDNVYFMEAPENFEALHRKALPFRRDRKSNFRAYPQYENSLERRELVVNTAVDLRTNFNVSFIRLKRSAVQWRKQFQRMSAQPAVVVRDQRLCSDHREFIGKVRAGALEASEFDVFLADKYGVDDDYHAVDGG